MRQNVHLERSFDLVIGQLHEGLSVYVSGVVHQQADLTIEFFFFLLKRFPIVLLI